MSGAIDDEYDLSRCVEQVRESFSICRRRRKSSWNWIADCEYELSAFCPWREQTACAPKAVPQRQMNLLVIT